MSFSTGGLLLNESLVVTSLHDLGEYWDATLKRALEAGSTSPPKTASNRRTFLTIKVLLGMALRQMTGFVESLLRLARLDWDVLDFSTTCRCQKALAVNIPYRDSKGPLC